MSYIYEALKRAEDENARGVVAPRTLGRPAFFAARPRWWLWALIGVLGANAALLVTLVLVRDSRSPGVTPATTTSSEPAAGPVVAPPRDADAARMTPSAPPAVPPAPPAVSAVPPAVAPPPRTVAPTPPAAPATLAAPPSARAAPPAPPVAERSAAPETPSVPRVEAPPAPTPSTDARDRDGSRRRSLRTTAPAEPGSPSGAAVAPPASAPAADAPKLQVQVVVYSDVAAERMVFIDGRRYREGDKVDAETVVERITPEGAIVVRRGQRFALTSGRP